VRRHELSIDRITRSRRNLFSSVRLDRLAEIRDDEGRVRQALASSDTRFVPLWRSRNLLAGTDDSQAPVYLPADEVGPLAAEQCPTLLGSDGQHCFFAIPVDDRKKDEILARRPEARFVDLRLASMDLDTGDAGVLAYARALLYWQYRHAYCGACGHPNRLESAGHRLVCGNSACARASFPRIDPAIIVLVTHEDACLLGHNADWPPRRFSTLAGFVEPGESLEDAVVREVFEEARVRLRGVRYASSQPWPFPSSAMCGFYAQADSRDCSPSDEMAELRWISAGRLQEALERDELRLPPPVSIAFRLISDWFRDQTGGDLEPLVRRAGSWIARRD
jgi:NAD+ diphosphatase